MPAAEGHGVLKVLELIVAYCGMSTFLLRNVTYPAKYLLRVAKCLLCFVECLHENARVSFRLPTLAHAWLAALVGAQAQAAGARGDGWRRGADTAGSVAGRRSP